MTDERLAEIVARKEALRLKLEIVMASDIPSRLKTARIHAVTREIVAMRLEVEAALKNGRNS